MKVVFLGVGSATDDKYSRTSVLIESETKILLDCGYDIPKELFRHNPDPDFLDAVYISHFHGDHWFGLPFVLLRFHEMKRKKKLVILGPEGIESMTKKLISLAYPNLFQKISASFPLEFIVSDRKIALNEFEIRTAVSGHPLENLAVALSTGDKKLGYSGDGKATEETKKLFERCDLLIHETGFFDEGNDDHGTVLEVVEMAEKLNIKKVAMVHMSSALSGRKKEFMGKIKDHETSGESAVSSFKGASSSASKQRFPHTLNKENRFFFPEDGDVVEV